MLRPSRMREKGCYLCTNFGPQTEIGFQMNYILLLIKPTIIMGIVGRCELMTSL